MGSMEFQRNLKAANAAEEEMPRAFAMARAVIHTWGQERASLVHAIALAIDRAHDLGVSGKELPITDPADYGRITPEEEEPVAPPVRMRTRRAVSEPPPVIATRITRRRT